VQRQIGEIKRSVKQEVKPVPAAVESVVKRSSSGHVSIVVGDKVRLVSFGSTASLMRSKHGLAEVRVKSLRFRERVENLELIAEDDTAPKGRQTRKAATVGQR
jgi:hypothetical protein